VPGLSLIILMSKEVVGVVNLSQSDEGSEGQILEILEFG